MKVNGEQQKIRQAYRVQVSALKKMDILYLTSIHSSHIQTMDVSVSVRSFLVSR